MKIPLWARLHYAIWGMYPITGGGGDQPEPPSVSAAAPTPEETTQQAIQSQIAATPQILATQREFGPQFTQLELEQLQEFGPQFAQTALDLQKRFGPQIGEALRAEQEAAQPELGAARRTLTEFLEQPEELTSEEQRKFTQDLRAAQGVRGFALESGLGAEDELRQLTELRQSLKTRRLNIALATAGRAPVTGGTQAQQTSFGPGQLVQNVTPGQIFGLAASTFGTQAGAQASIFGAQSAAATARRGQNIGLAQSFIPEVSFGFGGN